MNKRQFILKVSVMLAAMSNAVSFGMIIRYKDKDQKRVQASIASCLNVEKERVKALPLEGQGQYNLEKLYRNRHNPEFVQKFLSDEDNYVPVTLVHNVVNVHPKKGGIELNFFGVDPHHESFYHPYHKPFWDPYRESFFSDYHEKISKLGQERSRKALKQKRISCIYKNPSVYKINYNRNENHPLVLASLFGNNEDIQKELGSDPSDEAMHYAVLASINYPNKKNNALELLLPKIKQKNKQEILGIPIAKEVRVIMSYQFLGASADNKEIFELIAQKDPYNANTIKIYDPLYGYRSKKCTTLDLMIKDKEYFGQENIQIFADNGGYTAKTLGKMEYIGNVIKHLSNRRYSMTPEEREASNRFDGLIYANLRQRERAHNQQLNVVQVTEPDVD